MILRPYQSAAVDAIRDGFRTNRRILYQLPTGGGKCLAPWVKVLLYDGQQKRADRVVVGDVLMGPDSKPRNVLSVCFGEEEMFDVVPTKGQSYRVNKSHILTLQSTGGSGYYHSGRMIDVPLEKYLSESDTYKHCMKGVRVGVDFQESRQRLEIDPYFLGLWLGDGNSNGAAITTADKEIVEYVESIAQSIGATVRIEPAGGKSKTYYITYHRKTGRGHRSNHITRWLYNYNILNNKHIPLVYKTASRKNRLLLLAGLMDTDGYLGHSGYDYITKSKILARDVAFLCRSLGFAAYITPCRKSAYAGHSALYFRLSISGECSTIPCRLPRRICPDRKQKKNVLRTGIRIVPRGVGKYNGFEIDGDGRFLLSDFTVTHNTVVFGDITTRVSARGKSVWIIVHRAELLRQASRKLDECGVAHGLIASGHCPSGEPVQVASIQTLARRLDRYTAPDMVILDECHHALARQYTDVLSHCSRSYVLGVTATPCRLDGRGLGERFDHMLLGPSMRDLISDGYLVPPRVYGPPDSTADVVHSGLSSIPQRAGDYSAGDLMPILDKPRITGDAVDHYARLCPGVPAIAFCVSVDHAEHVAAEFTRAGIPSDVLHGGLSAPVREQRGRALASGALRVITTCDLVSEGYDVPACGCCIMLRPTASLGLYLQQAGRSLRTAPGKTHAVILDHVGNFERHGLPTYPREWSLDGARKRRDGKPAQQIRQCEACYAVYPASSTRCPQCGFSAEAGPKARAEMERVAGELRLIEDEKHEARDLQKRIHSADSLQGLLDIAEEKGYERGWAYIRWKLMQKKKNGNRGGSIV